MPANSDMMADFLWLQACYYFGDHATSDRQYDLLDEYLELITDLSPRWKAPFYFAVILLPLETGAVDLAFRFLDKALKTHPNEWQFWFFKGMYLMLNKNDLLAASKNLYKASTLPDAPRYLGRLSATLATRSGKRRMALRFLEEALAHTEDLDQRRILKQKLEELLTNGNPSDVE